SNRFSSNGDGKGRAPNDRISAHLDGAKPAHPDTQREQQIIKALTGRYDQIEALWKEAEEDLKRFRIPHAVEHCYRSDYDYGPPIHYFVSGTRYGKEWRIVHETRTAHSEIDDRHHDENELKPITDCPFGLRLAMIGEFENLRKKVIAAAEEAVP